MNITRNASTLEWLSNGSTLWAARIDDLSGNSVTFSEGYTPTVSGKLVKVTNGTRPTGTVSYATGDTGFSASAVLYGVGTAKDTEDAVSGTRTQVMQAVDMGTINWLSSVDSTSGKLLFYYNFTDKANGSLNLICSRYPVSNTILADMADKSIRGNGTTSYVYVYDTAYNDAAAFKTAMSGVMLYYELATPVTTTSSAQTVALAAGGNTFVQAYGDIANADATLSYTTHNQTIALDSTHRYVMNDNGQGGVSFTGQSSVECVGGEDQLVDLTRLCSGTALSATASSTWDSLKARIPEYASTVAYDTGTVVNSRPGVKVTGKNLFGGNTYVGGLNQSRSFLFNTTAISSPSTTFATYYGIGIKLYLLPGTYTISSDMTVSSGAILRAAAQYANEADCTNYNKMVTRAQTVVSGQAFTYTVQPGAPWVVFTWTAAATNTTFTWSWIQVELGSTVTAYEPYFDGGSAQASADLVSLTNVADTEDAVKGKRTARIASVDLGTLTYSSDYADPDTTHPYGYVGFWPAGKQNGLYNLLSADYGQPSTTGGSYRNDKSVVGTTNASTCYIIDSSLIGKTKAQIAAALSGKLLYYELATPSVTDITPSQITLQNGNNTVLQTAGSVNLTRLSLGYQGTSYNLTLTKNSKFVKRIDGTDSYVSQGSSNGTLAVVGGRDKLFNLTRWFGKGREPSSVDAFYRLYPAFKYADVPYTAGALVNFKGASIRTVGFNAYDHATGTARLIGGNEYQVCGTYESVSYVDQWGHAEELRINSEGIFTPANDGVLTVTGGNGTDTCVHLTWSGYKNYGEPEYKWEPYIENNKELPIATYFPDGMNGIAIVDNNVEYDHYVSDSLTATQASKCIGMHVFDGTEPFAITNYSTADVSVFYVYGDNFNTYIPGATTKYSTGWLWYVCNKLTPIKSESGAFTTPYALALNANGTKYIWLTLPASVAPDATAAKKWLKDQYDAGDPVVVYYELETPVVTLIDPQLNLTYSVNDFGTEEMLPYPDSITPLSTEFHGYIKYSVDFLRLNIHLSEWYNTIKTLVQNEPNYVLKDKTYDTLGAGTAFNLIDRNAQGSERQFTYDTSGGDVDLTDGTALVQHYMGTTLMQNQLVADTNVNTEDSANGVIEVTDAVTADAKGLTMYGESYVKNQLVSTDPVDNTESSTDGVIEITDGTANPANSLVMKGDSWVRNQLAPSVAQPKDANSNGGEIEVTDAVSGNANGLTMYGDSWVRNQLQQIENNTSNYVVGTASNNILSLSGTSSGGFYTAKPNLINSQNIVGHTYMLVVNILTNPNMVSLKYGWLNRNNVYTPNVVTGIAFVKVTVTQEMSTLGSSHGVVFPTGSNLTGITCWIECIDLTQLCNGDSTKIAAIQTWDDLVAAYPEYAHYVPYDTGTVMGVQPSVTNYGDEYAYGIVMDTTQDSIPCQRVELHNGVISNVESFSSMPAHDWHRCVMDNLSTRHVNYYLDPTDSTKKYNGTYKGVTSNGSASVLTGADGDVMVEMDVTHWRATPNYGGTGKHLYLVSDKPFKGSQIHRFFYTSPDGDIARTQYVGAYRAALCDASGNALNTTEGAISQNNGTAATRLGRSVAGALPWTSVTLTDLRTALVRNGGSHVNFDFHQYLYLMMMIEYATVNTQAISAGYSNGKTYTYWVFRKSGRTNYGNGTGQTLATANTTDDDNFYSLKVNNVQLYRDTAIDANGYYGWSTHTASPTRYWTNTATPANGSTAYSDTSGTASSYTTASWSTTSDANKVIQFQYRGIENPFGEVWEFEDGFQKYADIDILSVKNPSNVVFDRDPSQDATGAYAWTNSEAGTIWTAVEKSVSSTQAAFSDSAKTTSAGFTVAPNTWRQVTAGYWQTNATSDYTSTAQQTAGTKTYWWFDHEWPQSGYIKDIDPMTLLPTATGSPASGSARFRDYFYNDTASGSRVSYLGGYATHGAYDGMGNRGLLYGLPSSYVYIGGRASA